jgi:hypothetical protein
MICRYDKIIVCFVALCRSFASRSQTTTQKVISTIKIEGMELFCFYWIGDTIIGEIFFPNFSQKYPPVIIYGKFMDKCPKLSQMIILHPRISRDYKFHIHNSYELLFDAYYLGKLINQITY